MRALRLTLRRADPRRRFGDSPRRLRHPLFAASERLFFVMGRPRRVLVVPEARRRLRQPFRAALRCPAESPFQALRFTRRREVVALRFFVTLRRRFGVARRRLVVERRRRFGVTVAAARRLRQPFLAAARRLAVEVVRGFVEARRAAVRRVVRRFGAVRRVAVRRVAVRRFGEARRVVRRFVVLRAARALRKFFRLAARWAGVCALRLMLVFLRLVTELVRFRAELVLFRFSRASAAFAFWMRLLRVRPFMLERALRARPYAPRPLMAAMCVTPPLRFSVRRPVFLGGFTYA